MIDLKTKYGPTALVTGASSGIGEAFAREFAARGLNLVLVARRGEILERLRVEFEREHGVKALVIAQDLAAPDADARIEASLAEAGWTVDILVNNAGFGAYEEFGTGSPERDLAMIDVHCRAVVALTWRLLPAMKARRRGAVIIVSSVLGVMPAPWLSTYAATKAFDLMLGESLYGELKPHGIDVLAVMPTLTETGFDSGIDLTAMPVRMRRPDDVVRTTLKALGRKPSVADGPGAKLLTFAMGLVPRNWVLAAYRRFREAPGPRE